MHKITLVCSLHRESGLCNPAELLEILRAIEPDVVFEEMLPSDYDSYYKHGTKLNLESQAITRYREFKSFQQVPVDRYDMPRSLLVEIKRDFDSVVARVAQRSQEYQELSEAIYSAPQLGFRHLNSAAFAAMMARSFEIEEKTIAETGDQGLIRGLETWRRANQRRELAMIGNIYQYCRENVFDTGVFLVGAAHKKGMVKAIEERASTDPELIDWHFAYDDQVT